MKSTTVGVIYSDIQVHFSIPRDPAEGLLLGPGHGSMVTDDAGNDWFVYHAWIGPASNIEIDPPGRVICIDKIVSC